jgi:predicted Zn-dependent protease
MMPGLFKPGEIEQTSPPFRPYRTMKSSASRRLLLLPPLLLAAVVGLLACTTVPDLDRRTFNFVPQGQLNEMGLNEFEKIKRTKRVSNNQALNAKLQRVARRLVPVVPMPNAQWEFVLFEDNTPNAFALPGGKVGVNTGLFSVATSEAQIAAVVGHELGHVVAGHSGERLSTGILGTAAVVGLGAVMGNQPGVSPASRNIATGAAGAATALGMLRFSRGQELEADRLGAIYMARAGYDPRESIRLWENMAAYERRSGGGRRSEFLSSHPLDATRIANLQAFMPRALAEYRG